MATLIGDILKRVSIIRNGGILLGKNLVCDAHIKRPVRLVSHAHWDHTLGLERSISECEKVLMTPATKEMIEVIRGRKLSSSKVQILDYGVPFTYEGERITLHPAGHILGAAQVLLQTPDSLKLAYTGDFKLPEAEKILHPDVLVMEATYGNPTQVRSFEGRVEEEFISLVERCISMAPVYILGYHGKLEEALWMLGKADIPTPVTPVFLEGKTLKLAQAYEGYGFSFGRYAPLKPELESRLLKTGEPFLVLAHMRSRGKIPSGAVRIFLSGWEFEHPLRRLSDKKYSVALSDHSDFEGLMNYVGQSRPRLVVTDNHRVGDAYTLAEQIERRLSIPAVAMPQ
jgi:putative mRNA 3-end processing factor